MSFQGSSGTSLAMPEVELVVLLESAPQIAEINERVLETPNRPSDKAGF